ncbi:MAG TPA: hypothetical protein VJ749_18120 [Pyrinomonadaceae bacterium]|nr:hypothetical protein [Pyrinomonadaceae bacterium]
MYVSGRLFVIDDAGCRIHRGFACCHIEDAGEANRKGNKRVIYVNPVSAEGLENNPRLLNHTLNGYAATVLAELMHHAKASGIYDDRTLARAVFSLLTRKSVSIILCRKVMT